MGEIGDRLGETALLPARGEGSPKSDLRRRRTPWPSKPWDVAALALLVSLVSAAAMPAMGASYWTDEAIAVAIAHQPMVNIPATLRLDVSPPLYYLALHVWMSAFGDGEAATRALSLLFGLASLVVAWWVGRRLMGQRLAILLPLAIILVPRFMYNMTETRMYTMATLEIMALLGLYFACFVDRRVRLAPAFVVVAGALILTHNWGLIVTFGVGAAAVIQTHKDRRWLAIAAGSLGLVGLIYLMWIPSLLGQIRAGPAPWIPHIGPITELTWLLLAVALPPVLACLLVTLPVLVIYQRIRRPSWTTLPLPAGYLSLLLGFTVALASAAVASMDRPIWAPRYLFLAACPLILLCSIVLVRRTSTWLLVVAICAIVGSRSIGEAWTAEPAVNWKSIDRMLASDTKELVSPQDVVVVPAPDVSLMTHYLGHDFTYVSSLGVADPATGLADWRNRLDKYRRGVASSQLSAAVDALDPGQKILVIREIHRSGVAVFDAETREMSDLKRQLAADIRLVLADRRLMLYSATGASEPHDDSANIEIAVYQRR